MGPQYHPQSGYTVRRVMFIAVAPPRNPRRNRRTTSRGQSLVEFALLLPVMLAFLGLTIDFARVFQAWITLESATRDAAEAAATSATTSSDALDVARRTVCLQAQSVPGFDRSTSPSPDDIEACAAPAVTVEAFDRSTTAPGATDLYPIGSVTVRSSLPFTTLFHYPFISEDGGWTITTEASFSVVQGRE